MKNKVQFLNQKSSQNHKKSQKFKYQGTARFTVRVLWFSVRIPLFIDCIINNTQIIPSFKKGMTVVKAAVLGRAKR